MITAGTGEPGKKGIGVACTSDLRMKGGGKMNRTPVLFGGGLGWERGPPVFAQTGSGRCKSLPTFRKVKLISLKGGKNGKRF